MKKNCILILVFQLMFLSALPQTAVVVQHQGNSTVFSTLNPLNDAITAALPGDTVYVPGGLFGPLATINKKLVLIGAGHYPDSCLATGTTTITGDVNLGSDADGLVLQGLHIPGAVSFAYNARIDSVTVYRCYLGALTINGDYDTATNCRNVLLYQNVTTYLNISHSSSIRVFNNIINQLQYHSSGAWIRNNKISNLQFINYALIENNCIEGLYQVQFSTFRNNILSFAYGGDNNSWISNTTVPNFSGLYVRASAWFSYADDYHLANPSGYPGSDGLQAGIYGGFYPYKEGAVPTNPHIQSSSIPLQTNSNGQLNIQLRVAAQSN